MSDTVSSPWKIRDLILPRHERNSLQPRLSSLPLSLVRLESLSYFLAGVIRNVWLSSLEPPDGSKRRPALALTGKGGRSALPRRPGSSTPGHSAQYPLLPIIGSGEEASDGTGHRPDDERRPPAPGAPPANPRPMAAPEAAHATVSAAIFSTCVGVVASLNVLHLSQRNWLHTHGLPLSHETNRDVHRDWTTQ